STIQRGKPPEWWEKQKGSRGIRRGQWYRLVFQFPIRQALMIEGKNHHYLINLTLISLNEETVKIN
ncbi:hypothetical protein LJD41_21325, partial [Escherichia coli]|nr:hypothetical protein [Escherichia coli]